MYKSVAKLLGAVPIIMNDPARVSFFNERFVIGLIDI